MVNEILLGAGVGAALGLTGSGGVLAVPALILGLGFTLPEAVPVSLIAIGSASLIGTIEGLKQGLVRYRAAMVMAGAGVLFSPLGIWLSHVLPADIAMLMFCLLLFFIVGRTARQAASGRTTAEGEVPQARNCMLRPDTGRFRWNPRCFATMSGIGSLSGLFSGMFGVGGGFLIVPGVRQFSDLSMHSIVATSLAVITLISAGTITSALMHGVVIEPRSWWFIGATVTGLVIVRRLVPALPGHYLQWGFAALTAAVSVSLFIKTLISMLPV